MKLVMLRTVFGFLVFSATFSSAFSQIILTPFVSNASQVTEITNCGDNRIFIAEQPGRIKISDLNGNVNAGLFLDISAKVKLGNEMGLLGLAFSPDYLISGKFYVNYIDLAQNTIVSRFRVSQSNPDSALLSSEEVLLTIPQPYPNHNAGSMHFGPDGYLYIATGDGGAGGDPGNRAQNLKTLFGKILRIDVSGNTGYTIPADNPFVSDTAANDLIWCYGLRNPWRISFDDLTGDLWIGDVGQNLYEEIDFQPASSIGGENYGWRCYEGFHEFNITGCNPPSEYVYPVYENPHFPECSVTGGYVYRGGEYNEMFGKYFFTDYCSGRIRSLEDSAGTFVTTYYGQYVQFVFTTFGQDRYGELYLGRSTTGIDKISFGDCKPVAFISYADTIFHNSNTYLLRTPQGKNLKYQWFFNGNPIAGANKFYYQATVSGDYRVSVLKNDSCYNTSKSVALVLTQEQTFYLYPNPANDITQLVWGNNLKGNKQIEVYDVSGRKCFKAQIPSGPVSYDLKTDKFASGTYIVRVVNNGNDYYQKLIISKK